MKYPTLILTILFLFQIDFPVQASSLHDAVHANDKAKVERMLSKGEDINAKDAYHLTPLHRAIIEGKYGIAKFLIAKGADVNAKVNKSMTPLHWAVIEEKIEFAKGIYGKGVVVNANDNSSKPSSLTAANDMEMVKLLIANGADVNAKANNDWTPLYRVVSKEMANLLIEKGADVNAKDSSGETPLHVAINHGAKAVVEVLITKGANVNAKNNQGETPLEFAVDQDAKEIAELLIAKNIQVNAKVKITPTDSIPPGLYYNESGSATLAVTRSEPASPLTFKIKSKSPNGHLCNVSGVIKNNQAITEEKCVIQFNREPDSISVLAPDEFGEACRNHCGSGNTTFSDDFLITAPYCSSASLIQAEFSRNYKLAKYPKARDLLHELLSKCEQFMDWRTEASTRNDLAITEFRLKDNAACLKTLEPLKRDFIDDHDISEMSFRYPMMDEDLVEAMIKTTRFNWKKCGGILHKK